MSTYLTEDNLKFLFGDMYQYRIRLLLQGAPNAAQSMLRSLQDELFLLDGRGAPATEVKLKMQLVKAIVRGDAKGNEDLKPALLGLI